MSTRSRSILSSLALAAAVFFVAAAPAGVIVDESRRGPSAAVAASTPTRGERAVMHALEVVGTPYRWGGQSPSTGFDCSGLVRWAYSRVGIDLPHSSYALFGEGRRVRESQIEPGDLLFFEGLGHVGMYLGSGRMIHSPRSGRSVEVVRLSATNYGARLIGARRVTAA